MVTKVPRLGKALQIPSTISEKSNEDQDTQFEKWCDDMLEQTVPEHNPPQETVKVAAELIERMRRREMLNTMSKRERVCRLCKRK